MYLNRKNGNHQIMEDKVLGITGHIEKTRTIQDQTDKLGSRCLL